MTIAKTLAASVAAIAVAAAPAFAGSTPKIQKEAVSIAGYDLSTETGAKIVLEKISAAAQRVCDVREHRLSLQDHAASKTCMAEAMNAAIAQINKPVLNRLYAAYATRKF